jgi:hypothetical protein
MYPDSSVYAGPQTSSSNCRAVTRRQPDLADCRRHPLGREVDREVVGRDDRLLGCRRRAAPQRRAQTSEQLLHVERLGDAVVCAGVERGDLVGAIVAGREDDDRTRTRATLALSMTSRRATSAAATAIGATPASATHSTRVDRLSVRSMEIGVATVSRLLPRLHAISAPPAAISTRR